MTGIFFLYFLKLQYVSAMLTSGNQSDEQRLLSDLLRHYDSAARPLPDVQNYTGGVQQVTVTITLQLSKMDGINPKKQTFTASGWITTNPKKQTFTASGWITTEWVDDRLSWDPDEYGGIDEVFLPPSSLWLPRFTLDNSASETQYEEDHYRWFWATVYSSGDVMWEPGGTFKSKCKVDVKLFPFDDQICEFIFANWVFPGNYVNLTYHVTDTLLETYSENGEWSIVNTSVWRQDYYYEGYPVPYPEVHYMLQLRRKPLYFTVNIIIPSVFLSALVLLVFKLPPDSGEKVSMGVTLLLSYSVFILMISENVPETSDGVPIIVVYLITLMATTCATVALSVFVLDLHHRDGLQRPGHGLKVAILGLAHITRLKVSHLELEHVRHGSQLAENGASHMVGSSDQTKNGILGKHNGSKFGNNVEKIKPKLELFPSMAKPPDKPESLDEVAESELAQIRRIIQRHETSVRKENQQEAARHEWKEIARIVDRFCLFVSVLVLLLVTPLMLGLGPFVTAKAQL